MTSEEGHHQHYYHFQPSFHCFHREIQEKYPKISWSGSEGNKKITTNFRVKEEE